MPGRDARAAVRGRIAGLLGWAGGVLVVVIGLAGADRPPPPGFVWMLVAGVVLGVAVRVFAPRALVVWDSRGAAAVLWRAAVLGMAVGATVGALAAGFASGEPSVVVSPGARLIGVIVLAAAGAAGSVCLAAAARILDQRARVEG